MDEMNKKFDYKNRLDKKDLVSVVPTSSIFF